MRTSAAAKRIVIVAVVLLALGLFLQPEAGAVVNWTKQNSGDAVLSSSPATWDAYSIERPVVLKDYNTFEMWYTGKKVDVGSGNTYYIGHASNPSGDGISWVKHGTYVLGPTPSPALGGNPNAQDTGNVAFCSVINAGNGNYKMWYSGTTHYSQYNSEIGSGISAFQIFYATSTDGGMTWSKYNNAVTPAVKRGAPGSWDQDIVCAPWVIYDSGATPAYRMWYTGFSAATDAAAIGYAESGDGITWTKLSFPLIQRSPAGAWDANEVLFPSVVKDGGLYRMWFHGSTGQDWMESIGYAYSMDGTSWLKYAGNPALIASPSGSGKFDADGAGQPTVLKDGNTYKIWYAGQAQSGGPSFGYATAPAYPTAASGGHLQINYASVANRKVMGASGVSNTTVMLSVIPEGPSPVDVNNLKVTWPSGGVSRFADSNIANNYGHQYPQMSIGLPAGQSTPSGTYTFSVTANSDETATRQLILTASDLPFLQDGSGAGYLNREIQLGVTTWTEMSGVSQAYIAGTTPTLRWKPSAGDNRYYRVIVRDWKNMVNYFISEFTLGSAKGGDGYMSVTVPSDALRWNRPYYWMILASDTDDMWSAKNDSMSDRYPFYTGTKDTSSPYDFLADAYIEAGVEYRSSPMGGTQIAYRAAVANLAPWDIDTTTNKFRVDTSAVTPFYFNPNDSSQIYMSDTHPYFNTANISVTAFPVSPTTYDFYIYEKGTSNNDTASVSITAASVSPYQITKLDMSPADNTYLSGTSFILSWTSKGAPYYRVRLWDWNMNRSPYASNWIAGGSPGNTLSVSIPDGLLKEYSPYRWWVEAADTTSNNYNSAWSNRLGFMTGGAAVGKGWAADFGTTGLWHYDLADGWRQLNTSNPGIMVAADVDNDGVDELVVGFSGYGLYYYDEAQGWVKINGAIPEAMVRYGNGVAVDFGSTYGLWRYNTSSGWKQLNTVDPGIMVAADVDGDGADELVVAFSGYGLYCHKLSGAWTQINTVLPTAMVRYGNGIAADFGVTNGLYRYTKTGGWIQLSNADPGVMVTADVDNDGMDELVVAFTGYGLYYHDLSSGWTQINTVLPSAVTRHGKGVAADYGSTYGLWRYAATGGWKKLNFVDPGIMAATDLSGTLEDKQLAVAFSIYGLYYYDLNANSWEPLNTLIPENLIKIDLFD